MADACTSSIKGSPSARGSSFIEGISKSSYVRQASDLKGSFLKLSIVNPRLCVMEKMIRSHFVDKIGKESIFLCIEDAIEASLFSEKRQV